MFSCGITRAKGDYSQGLRRTQGKIAKKAGKMRVSWRCVEIAAENAPRKPIAPFSLGFPRRTVLTNEPGRWELNHARGRKLEGPRAENQRRGEVGKAPVAVTFLDAALAGVKKFDGTEPSGCSFWRLAAEGRVFYTVPENHFNCAVGAY
jgi:hypothetical protein